MSVSEPDRKVVAALFAAMQAGPDGEERMMALFAEDGVLLEGFTGEMREHRGKAAVREAFRDLSDQPPDMELHVDRVELEGDTIRADWTCTSSVFPTPMRGVDRFTLSGGLIQRLEVVVTEMPPMED